MLRCVLRAWERCAPHEGGKPGRPRPVRIVPAVSGAAGDCKQIAVMKEEALKRLSDMTYVVSSELALK